MTKIAVKGKSSHETRMEEVMTPSPITVTPQHRLVTLVGGWGLILQLPGKNLHIFVSIGQHIPGKPQCLTLILFHTACWM